MAKNGAAGDVLQGAPWATASVGHPLSIKAAAQLRAPLQWTGGMAVELLKGPASQPPVLGIVTSLSLGRLERSMVDGWGGCCSQLSSVGLMPLSVGLVFGQRHGHGAPVTSVMPVAAQANLTAALLFLDVTASAPSVVQGFVLPSMQFQRYEELLRALVLSGFTVEDAA